MQVCGEANPANYIVRAGTQADEGFIAQCWADTFRGSSPRMKRLADTSLFNKFVYRRIEKILKTAKVKVAGPQASDIIYGYSVMEPELLHMVYVRKPWRRMGIAKALLKGVSLESCAWTTPSQDMSWVCDKYRFLGYQPFYMIELDGE